MASSECVRASCVPQKGPLNFITAYGFVDEGVTHWLERRTSGVRNVRDKDVVSRLLEAVALDNLVRLGRVHCPVVDDQVPALSQQLRTCHVCICRKLARASESCTSPKQAQTFVKDLQQLS